jgi:uncharacterized protein YndB with AHSA1/START domain
MTDSEDVVTVERFIPAPPERIFDLLADPRRHSEIDGSGSVRYAKSGGGERLALGSKFGMAMKMGLPYSMVNTVIEYEDGRRIAWQTWPPVLPQIAGGRIWRYELEPTDGGTIVRETWDVSEERTPTKALVRKGAGKTRENMEKTLARIESLTA